MCSLFQLKTDISFFSVNTRGLKDSVKRKAIFLFCKGQQANCVFLQETHSDETDVKFWSQQWGDKIFFSHGTNRSAGVAICLNRCPDGTCPRFRIERGIRQGCSISPLLFIVATELLAITILNSSIKGLEINNNRLIISQLADDTTIFLKNKEQIPLALDTIQTFSQASGLLLNLDKCELMSIHNSSESSLYNIPIKTEVKYLGIWITKYADERVKKNIQNVSETCKKRLNIWLQRDLTLFGRTMLTKIESLSRLIYPAYSLAIPQKFIKEINRTNFNFIWKNKHHYINNRDLIKGYEEGGIKAIDFEIMNILLKIRWLQSFLKNDNGIWFSLPAFIFNKVGGIQFLLVCDFEISKLPIKLSKFHQQVLLHWKMIFKHNFSPHNVPLWNNRVILNRRKSMFIEEWLTKKIWSILHIMDENGNILEFNDFNAKYNMSCSYNVYKTVVQNIPNAFIQSIRNNILCISCPNLHKVKLDELDLLLKERDPSVPRVRRLKRLWKPGNSLTIHFIP
ncbi:uncharacterized protein LOC121191268 [Toxotes jaculatrix]|uniref:uncharacterized protein LOC121191268 n=1 Tax=Toxotes jaculatrix TaxID=941984 RepID=UPI001B3A8CA0|nr:uncharacterized protein LOC121191268 [Toxotes jaculatrix]